jgi:hypothetical protein
MSFTRLWIDDLRPIPEDYDHTEWTSARSFHEAIVKLELLEIEEVSFDHDLGENSIYGYKEMTGYDVVMWLCARQQNGLPTPNVYQIHSANPVGVNNMKQMIESYLADAVKVISSLN